VAIEESVRLVRQTSGERTQTFWLRRALRTSPARFIFSATCRYANPDHDMMPRDPEKGPFGGIRSRLRRHPSSGCPLCIWSAMDISSSYGAALIGCFLSTIFWTVLLTQT
jgi:hypothetical protein